MVILDVRGQQVFLSWIVFQGATPLGISITYTAGYTRLRQEGDDELVSPVAGDDVKPLEPPASQQAAETKEEGPETAPPIPPGQEPVTSTAMPPPEYQPTAVPVGLPGQEPPGVPPPGLLPVAAASAMDTTTVS